MTKEQAIGEMKYRLGKIAGLVRWRLWKRKSLFIIDRRQEEISAAY